MMMSLSIILFVICIILLIIISMSSISYTKIMLGESLFNSLNQILIYLALRFYSFFKLILI
jgi:hypothetical protein